MKCEIDNIAAGNVDWASMYCITHFLAQTTPHVNQLKVVEYAVVGEFQVEIVYDYTDNLIKKHIYIKYLYYNTLRSSVCLFVCVYVC